MASLFVMWCCLLCASVFFIGAGRTDFLIGQLVLYGVGGFYLYLAALEFRDR